MKNCGTLNYTIVCALLPVILFCLTACDTRYDDSDGDVTFESFTNSLGMTFNLIRSGTFLMGSPEDEVGRDTEVDNDETQHEVTLTQPYYMQTTEVTQGQWKAVMGDDNNPSSYSKCGDACPVEEVSWHNAQEFIEALNNMIDDGEYRLPTEAEWEYAARAGSDTAFANGDISVTKCTYDPNLDAMGWYCYNSERLIHPVGQNATHPVGQKDANAWGLYDMHGNVWEWCQDWYGDYPTNSVRDPEGPDTGSDRVVRGGSWISDARYCRSAFRNGVMPYDRTYNLGFRLVLLRGAKRTWYRDSDSDNFGDHLASVIAESRPEGYVFNNKDCDDEDPDIHPDAVEIPENDIDENCDGIIKKTLESSESFANSLGMTFNLIPVGTFMMGSPENEDYRYYYENQHLVTLTQPFYMQTTEVTQGQWKAVMGEDNNPSDFSECGDSCPVDNISWHDAQEFIEALNNNMTDDGEYRLPTEAEWEYAARAGSEMAFSNGDISVVDCSYDLNLDAMGWYCYNSEYRIHPVGQKDANAWGLYDMHGNVWEWCQDWHGDYPTNSVRDPEGPDTGSDRVLRGGGWASYARFCRSANRISERPGLQTHDLGFRLVLLRGTKRTWYRDSDSDNFGDHLASVIAESRPEGYVFSNKDCDDESPDIHPDAVEIPENDIDENCDGIIKKTLESSESFANSLGMAFNLIPVRTFLMGSPEDEPGRYDDETQHIVTLTQPFYMQTTEVTQGQWKAVMGEDNNPSNFLECGDDCPVEQVSWNMGQEFIDALNNMTNDGEYRLPTEAEWEYAARAGSEMAFPNGDISVIDCSYDPNLDAMGWYCYNSERSTHPVGQKNANAWGLYDMHGNVSEWCQDWYTGIPFPYPSGSVRDPEGPDTGVDRVLRGGNWDNRAEYCRSASRYYFMPGLRNSEIGFRLVLLRGL